jgi:uncharacterized protein
MALGPSSGEGPAANPTAALFESVPLFPLPNVVLFPRAVLPLHIFEERYKSMTADALAGRRRIAMALLKPGWEKNYYGRPTIDPVVCVGEILTHEQLPDGKYNFLLQGVARARISQEIPSLGDKPYRVADLEPLHETKVIDIELADERRRLSDLLKSHIAAEVPCAKQFLQLLDGPLSTASVADLVAFHVLDDVAIKQSLLAECDIRRRISRLIDALKRLHPPAVPAALSKFPNGQCWN